MLPSTSPRWPFNCDLQEVLPMKYTLPRFAWVQGRRVWLAAALCTALAAQCTGAQAQQSEIEDGDWRNLNPLAQRVDATQLDALTQHLLAEHPAVRSLLMVRNGQPVYEYYAAGVQADSLHNVYSVTKSVVALLAGRAIDQGLIRGTQEKLIDLLPTAPSTVGDIRLEHLLTMAAGFDPGGVSRSEDYLDFTRRFFAPGLQAHALGRPVRRPPGEQFFYNNMDAHLVSLALAARVGMPAAKYAETQLFKPLGISQYAWSADVNGVNNGASELRLRARDMAKIGQLMLQNGQWRGQQLVSSAFVEAATQRRIDTSVVSEGASRPMG
jgi:CubicO group peptidase (beta-lactamase class C family)